MLCTYEYHFDLFERSRGKENNFFNLSPNSLTFSFSTSKFPYFESEIRYFCFFPLKKKFHDISCFSILVYFYRIKIFHFYNVYSYGLGRNSFNKLIFIKEKMKNKKHNSLTFVFLRCFLTLASCITRINFHFDGPEQKGLMYYIKFFRKVKKSWHLLCIEEMHFWIFTVLLKGIWIFDMLDT